MSGKAGTFAIFALVFVAFIFWLYNSEKLKPILQTINAPQGGALPSPGSPGAGGVVSAGFVSPGASTWGSMTPGITSENTGFGIQSLAQSFIVSGAPVPQPGSARSGSVVTGNRSPADQRHDAKMALTNAGLDAAQSSGNPYVMVGATIAKALNWHF